MYRDVLQEMFHIVDFQGWTSPEALYSTGRPTYDGTVNFCEALLIACHFDLERYRVMCDYFCELLGVQDSRGIVSWECERGRTQQHVMDVINKAQFDLSQLVKPQ